MSTDETTGQPTRLALTSYVVLGLIQASGPTTPYGLKRQVAATIGHFWSFPHALLYKEPPRLVELGLLTEERELAGRRRRLFAITQAGRSAVREWLGEPSRDTIELRDSGLLQLFFMDGSAIAQRRVLAEVQLAIHRLSLAQYEHEQSVQNELERPDLAPAVERWRGATLPMGILYERAAIEFWEGVASAGTVGTD